MCSVLPASMRWNQFFPKLQTLKSFSGTWFSKSNSFLQKYSSSCRMADAPRNQTLQSGYVCLCVHVCIDNLWDEDTEQQSALTRRNMILVQLVISFPPSQGGQISLLPCVLLFSKLGAHDRVQGRGIINLNPVHKLFFSILLPLSSLCFTQTRHRCSHTGQHVVFCHTNVRADVKNLLNWFVIIYFITCCKCNSGNKQVCASMDMLSE